MPTTPVVSVSNTLQETDNTSSFYLMTKRIDDAENHRVQVEVTDASTIMNFTQDIRKATVILTPDGKMELSINGNVVGEITTAGLVII